MIYMGTKILSFHFKYFKPITKLQKYYIKLKETSCWCVVKV